MKVKLICARGHKWDGTCPGDSFDRDLLETSSSCPVCHHGYVSYEDGGKVISILARQPVEAKVEPKVEPKVEKSEPEEKA